MPILLLPALLSAGFLLLLGSAGAVGEAAAPAAGSVPAWPAAVNLVYRTEGDTRVAGLPLTLHARTTTRWVRAGDRYETHLHTDTISFDQASSGHLGPDGALVPEQYTEKRPFHSAEGVHIDWTHGQIRFGEAAPARAPEPGAQDRLSLQFEMARLRQLHPEHFAPGAVYAVNLIGTHDVDPWTFSITEDAAVQTGRGTMKATRFSARRTVGQVEETMDVWLGADVWWMPVRIRIVDRHASVIDSILQDFELP